jgi:hypothetical protein
MIRDAQDPSEPNDASLIAAVRNALPLIAAVVEAAEAVADHENDTSEARRFVRGPLTALQEHLEGQ